MKDFFVYNWKTITLTILGVIFVYLLVRVFTPIPDHSELNKYKLDQIDQKVKDIEKLQKDIRDSIKLYRSQIKDIDTDENKYLKIFNTIKIPITVICLLIIIYIYLNNTNEPIQNNLNVYTSIPKF
jgi:hypothetical protein